jgi:hypothetical protein
MLPQAFLPWKTAGHSIMDECRHTTPWLFKMEGLESLTFRWSLYLEYNSDVVCIIFA